MGDTSQKQEMWRVLNNLEAAQKVGGCPVQVTRLVWTSSMQVFLVLESAALIACKCLGREESSKYGQFQKLPLGVELFTSST